MERAYPQVSKRQKGVFIEATVLLGRLVYNEGLQVGDRITHRKVRIAGDHLDRLHRAGYVDEELRITEYGWRMVAGR